MNLLRILIRGKILPVETKLWGLGMSVEPKCILPRRCTHPQVKKLIKTRLGLANPWDPQQTEAHSSNINYGSGHTRLGANTARILFLYNGLLRMVFALSKGRRKRRRTRRRERRKRRDSDFMSVCDLQSLKYSSLPPTLLFSTASVTHGESPSGSK